MLDRLLLEERQIVWGSAMPVRDRRLYTMAGGQLSYENPEQIYAQLSPDQRAAIAREFMQGLQQEGSPMAQKFAGMDPAQVSPQQLAAMHQHARQDHPGLLGRVMRHPIAVAALGGLAAYEIDKHLSR